MPSCSIGFCVARTKKGWSIVYVSPPVVTLFSCIASSRADWVLGGVLFISSAKSIFEKMGPLINFNVLSPVSGFWLIISVPVISEGIKSGVNCILLKSKSKISEIVFIIRVLPNPGTPSNKICPLHNNAIKTCSITSFCPTITLLISE